ncbi:fimbria/pilus outer membrane usher protein [Paraburkholderia aromaticivorans]|uniref:fimbria/pilus outer membrane usher protein n=1 Tax=Paraburkholderia aromaticivorans TaxID=2026199 RepID=UPI0014561DD9|nr:fimbria/pilus outer membrane usher protein [Paraburkholderia aromaticivorans]
MKSSRQIQSKTGINGEHGSFGLKPITAVVLSALAVLGYMVQENASAKDAAQVAGAVTFDTTFLQTDAKQTVDVSRFARGNIVSPGVYPVDLLVNDVRVAHDNVRFVATRDGESARACFDRKTLEGYGIDFAKVDAERNESATKSAANDCIDVAAAVPEASIEFDFTEQKIAIAVPQKYMRNSARGYVPPELWENGVNAGFISYNANAYQSNSGGVQSTQAYLGLNAGVNIGAWHFRHQSSVTAATGQATQFDNIATYVQHDVAKLRSQVTLGDAQTTGDVFDSVSFRGAQIATDDRMLPESLRGYAPVVRGTADSNARVTVRQNAQVIYETSVSPGPFEIKDLYATGYGGNLDVTVTEADGRTKSFTVPYAAVAQSLRPGTTRFAVTAGQLRDDSLQTKPGFTQFTMQRGLTNLVTLYGGVLASSGYVAANMGAAFNTKYGAFASDITTARTEVPGDKSLHGNSLHIGYSKFIDPTSTNIAVGAYRFSDSGYLNFADAASLRDLALHDGDVNAADRQRGRLQLTVNQSLKNGSSVFLTASSQHYWNRPGRDVFYQAGYSNGFKFGTYSVTAGRTRSSDGTLSNEIMLSTTIPLGHTPHAPVLTTNLNAGSGAATMQANISGSAGDHNQYSYNAYGTAGQSSSSAANVNGGVSGVYRAPYAQMTASASAGSNSTQASAGVSGSIVAHPGGVTFSQTVGDTFGIVEAPGAAGATVSSATGGKLDHRGYAVVPYLTPYSMNTVDIDPKGSSSDVEFESTSERAVPRLGSVVMLKYKTVTGRAALIHAPRLGGEGLPFGADVLDADGNQVGMVAQGSRIFARGVGDQGTLVVKLGEKNGEVCRIKYSLPVKSSTSEAAYTLIEGHCVDDSATEPMPVLHAADHSAD